MRKLTCILSTVVPALLCGLAAPEDQISFGAVSVLSAEWDVVPGGADPGGAAAKVKLLRLTKTPAGVHDGRLVATYADANTEGLVWHPRGGVYNAKDVFTRWSDDEGVTWSDPVNLSGSARSWSAKADWNADGVPEPYWGDCGKPNVFSSGDVVVVSWISRYCPEKGWPWGQSGESAVQGVADYPDLDVYPNVRQLPFAGVYVAVSPDGGETWDWGHANPPLQLTYGRRDAIQDVHRGSGKRWVVTWQEDPEGLQPGNAEGPGEGASGAKVTKGTDIWYAWTSDVTVDAAALRSNRTPLSNHSTYDRTVVSGFPLVGEPGSLEHHGASRANLFLVNDGGTFRALVAYEETKGIPDVIEGKTVQYHAFPFDAPVVQGPETARAGSPGTTLSAPLENSRRARFVAQPPDGVQTAIAIFWRQGFDSEGAPADIILKTSTSLDEAAVAAAPTRNISTQSPNATAANLSDPTDADSLEDARAHRAVLRGDMLVVGYSYTWNGPLARYTDLANYNFHMRRSLDGGATWLGQQDLSGVFDTKVNVFEPRLVAPAKTGTHDEAVFIAAWGTETNVYDGIEEPTPLDIWMTRTADQGETFSKVVPVCALPTAEFESQLRIDDAAHEVYAVLNQSDGLSTDAVFTHGVLVVVPESVGPLFCFGNGSGTPCPCGNDSEAETGQGCANSTGIGAVLYGSGSTSVAADDLALNAAGMVPLQPALAFRGMEPLAGGLGLPFGAGLRCVGEGVSRLYTLAADGAGAQTWGPFLVSRLGALPGDQLLFQIWYRDPAAACGDGFNTTNALGVMLTP